MRFTSEDLRRMGSSAKLRKESISGWLRRVLPREAQHKGYNIQLTLRIADPTGFQTLGWIISPHADVRPIPVVPPGSYATKKSALEAGMAWCRERIDLGNTKRCGLPPL